MVSPASSSQVRQADPAERPPHTHPQAVAELLNRTRADSVYMLLHPGWASEARANRWHMAVRWARHLPLTLVVPEKTLLGRPVVDEPRIPNCRILRVPANHGQVWGVPAQLQVAAVLKHMRRSGHRRPILWTYNPTMLEVFAAVPAVARVHHVTENFFDFGTLTDEYLERVRQVARLADLNVAVSDGCARPLAGGVESHCLLVATNGCDFAAYGADGPPDAEVAAMRGTFSRIAVFAGNVNYRLDFDLIARAADAKPDVLLLFVGGVKLPADLAARWRDLLARRNVRYLGPVNPDRLPAIYRAADFGIVPYVRTPMITENGFPLKILEMAATGLPMVTTLMRPLKPLAPVIHVSDDSDGFLHAMRTLRRSDSQAVALRALAQVNDYDARFDSIAERIASVQPREGDRLDLLPAPFRGTGDAVRNALVSQVWSPRMLWWHFRILVLGRLASLVDALPDPVRHRVVRAKRMFIAPSKVAS